MTEIMVVALIRKIVELVSGWLALFLAGASSVLKTRAALQLENVALRHQIGVFQRSQKKRPRLHAPDRLLWVWLSRVWTDWRSAHAPLAPKPDRARQYWAPYKGCSADRPEPDCSPPFLRRAFRQSYGQPGTAWERAPVASGSTRTGPWPVPGRHEPVLDLLPSEVRFHL